MKTVRESAAFPQYYTSNQDKRATHYGNPPLRFGLPGQEGPPVVLDVATCILADYQRGEAIEEQIPAAFFKSMGYTAIATLFGRRFYRPRLRPRTSDLRKIASLPHGSLVIVMYLGLFAPVADVRLGMEQMVPLRGYDEVTLPGTTEHRNEEAYSRDGIPIAFEDVGRLEECGRKFRIARPWLD